MAVILTDMNMPKCCRDCIFWNSYEGNCREIIPSKWKDFDIDEEYEKRADGCPLKSVDEMMAEIADYKIMENPIGYILRVVHKYTER